MTAPKHFTPPIPDTPVETFSDEWWGMSEIPAEGDEDWIADVDVPEDPRGEFPPFRGDYE